MGGSCTQAGIPGINEPGRPEGLPRTTAITECTQKASAAYVMKGAFCAVYTSGFQPRPLNWQRLAKAKLLPSEGQP